MKTFIHQFFLNTNLNNNLNADTEAQNFNILQVYKYIKNKVHLFFL